MRANVETPFRDVFDKERLPPALEEFLRSTNPWWEGKPGPLMPPYHRWVFHTTLRKLHSSLAPVTVLRGPRQVGKTTLQQQVIAHLIRDKGVHPNRILQVQFDEIESLSGLIDPILAIGRWFENRILGRTFNEAAHAGEPAYLFFDEVQNLSDWAPQLKALVDHHTAKVLVTGSSALRIEAGRDSLAGRITQVELGTLLLREIAGLREGVTLQPALPENGLEPLLDPDFWRGGAADGLANRSIRDRCFSSFSERGGYPMSQGQTDVPWAEVAGHLSETVIKRAIQHDLRIGSRGAKRDTLLLEEVFRLACRYAGQAPGQAVFVQEIKQALHSNIGWNRILSYLRFLDGALLVRLVEPLEVRLKRKKGNRKVCLCDHGLRAAWLQEKIPLDQATLEASPHLHDLAGHIAESVVGYFLSGIPHLDLAWFPERGAEPEVDYILTIGEKRIPLEIKYRRRIDPHRDTLGLRAFLEKTVYNAPFGILVTLTDDVVIPDPRIVPISLPSLLLLR
ncbi:MAG: ATP-binding protein [Candidatus Omnitrophica bacterium]|nr:ATP-binding protein [Candidatus Omnitrophota bacterium]